VLTGVVPIVEGLTASIEQRSSYPAVTRLLLSVDPTVSPDELRTMYAELRTLVLGRRYRKISDKHLQLAVIAATKDEGQTWKRLMADWNETQSREWKYSEPTNFAKDAKRAYEKVVRPFELDAPHADGIRLIKFDDVRINLDEAQEEQNG